MRHFTGFLTCIILLAVLFTGSASAASSVVYTADELFTERDLQQTADLTGAVIYTVSDGQNIRITSAGVYMLTGTARNATVIVEAEKDDKVQLILDGVSITNADFPAIYIKAADKVFITVSGDSSLSVTGAFRADDSTNTDGVIFSKIDLTMNGTAALTISSTNNGIVCKDDLKITGGIYQISASSKAVEANDSIRIAGGTLNLTAGTDGLHAENEEDAAKGYVYICGGSLTANAGDDGVHGTSVVQIDSGNLNICAAEGIEGTYIQINGGTINIQSSDDGINAARKSNAYTPIIEINDGDITIVMGGGDTDGIDANGHIIVNGGIIRVTGNSTFDYDGTAEYNGGTIIVNGQQVRRKYPLIIRGTFSMAVMNALSYTWIPDWTKQLSALNSELEKLAKKREMAAKENQPRILLTGSPVIFPNFKLPLLIETMGGLLAADETCMGERGFYDPPAIVDHTLDGMLRALSNRATRPCTCPTFADNQRRVFRVRQLIKDYRIQGVIYHVLRGCLVYDYEYQALEEEMGKLGIPIIRVETDYNEEDVEQLRIRVEAFIELIKYGRNQQ